MPTTPPSDRTRAKGLPPLYLTLTEVGDIRPAHQKYETNPIPAPPISAKRTQFTTSPRSSRLDSGIGLTPKMRNEPNFHLAAPPNMRNKPNLPYHRHLAAQTTPNCAKRHYCVILQTSSQSCLPIRRTRYSWSCYCGYFTESLNFVTIPCISADIVEAPRPAPSKQSGYLPPKST